MRIRMFLLMAVFAAALTSSASGQVATKKFPWQPVGGVQNIDVATENVVVGQVVFDLGSTLKGTPLRKSSANAYRSWAWWRSPTGRGCCAIRFRAARQAPNYSVCSLPSA